MFFLGQMVSFSHILVLNNKFGSTREVRFPFRFLKFANIWQFREPERSSFPCLVILNAYWRLATPLPPRVPFERGWHLTLCRFPAPVVHSAGGGPGAGLERGQPLAPAAPRGPDPAGLANGVGGPGSIHGFHWLKRNICFLFLFFHFPGLFL